MRNASLPLDRRNGFARGYALVEYELEEEAESAISALNGSDFRGKKLDCDWAFVTPSNSK